DCCSCCCQVCPRMRRAPFYLQTPSHYISHHDTCVTLHWKISSAGSTICSWSFVQTHSHMRRHTHTLSDTLTDSLHVASCLLLIQTNTVCQMNAEKGKL